MKQVCLTLMLVALVANVPTAAAEAQPEDTLRMSRKTIVGSWLDTVAVAGGPTFKSLSTYTADGTWISSDGGSVITEPPFPHVFSGGHGVWVHRGGRTFGRTSLQLVSGLAGELLFTIKLQQTIRLNRSGDAYRAVWKAEFTDPAGQLAMSLEGTTEGRRITFEP